MAKTTENTAPEPVEELEVTEEPTELELVAEQEAEEADLLADLPDLIPPAKLRIRHKNRLKRISLKAAPTMARVRALRDEDESDEATAADAELAEMVMELTEQVDEFAEAIAFDKAAYAAWAEGKDTEHFMALFSRYMRASGE